MNTVDVVVLVLVSTSSLLLVGAGVIDVVKDFKRLNRWYMEAIGVYISLGLAAICVIGMIAIGVHAALDKSNRW